jgi:hypothetical protein
MGFAVTSPIETLAGQQDVSIGSLPDGTMSINIPKVTGDCVPPLWLTDLSRGYSRNLDRAVLGIRKPMRKRHAPRRMPSYRERQRRARAAQGRHA